ncbi:hypothetical protein STEG23_021752 [Scotinomys teguina]
MYPDLAELEDSDVSDDGSEYTEGVQSIIEQLESTNIQGKDGGKGIKGKGSARIDTFPASRRLPSAPPTYVMAIAAITALAFDKTIAAIMAAVMPKSRRSLKSVIIGNVLGSTLTRMGTKAQQDPVWVPERLVRRIPEDRKAEDVASMDDVGSAEPAVVGDIGPAVPLNGDHA